jgi:predicted Zn-dependent protease
MRPIAIAVVIAGFSIGSLWAGDSKKDDPNQIGNRDVGRGLNFYSIEKEMALGRQLAQEVQRQAKILDDPLISEYVNRIGQNLVRHSDAKVPFTFKVIEGPQLNAFALPGGYVFVYTGLIRVADEEDEFAGAMAHEIAHVAARHMTRQMTRNQLVNMGMVPLSVLLGGVGGYGVRQGAGLAGQMAFLSFDRKDEAEADYLGVQYMYSAGYDPNGAISIFEKLEVLSREKSDLVSRLLASHPMDADRIAKAQQEIQAILPSRQSYVVTTSEYDFIRHRMLDLMDQQKQPAKEPRPQLRVGPGSGSPATQDGGSDERPTVRRRDFFPPHIR